jgi:small subunit ribosomal protein S9
MYFNAVGRRKTSVARVHMKEGSGAFTINKRPFKEYLNNALLEYQVRKPFEVSELELGTFDIKINVEGGGPSGQAEAIRLALSRALEIYNPELRPALKKEGLLSVDARQVERKKYGKLKARKSPQFSKR